MDTPVFYHDREQRQVDQLMLVLRPDDVPLFRNRGEAMAALRRLRAIKKIRKPLLFRT